MSRGHGRVHRVVRESVNATRYGCTVPQLTYLAYRIGRADDGPTETQVAVVRRAVRRLLDEGLAVERVVLGADRYIMPATPPAPRSAPRRSSGRINLALRQTLQCRDCDLRWVSEENAPHRLCWSCGEPGQPVKLRGRRRSA